MLNFYNGISLEQIDNMEVSEFNQYWNAITMIEAQGMLMNLTTQDYPHLQKNKRSQIHRKLSSLAYPSKKQELMTTKEIADYLNRELNGF